MNVLGIAATVEQTNGWHAVGSLSCLDLEAFALTSDAARFQHPLAQLAALGTAIDDVLEHCAAVAPPGYVFLQSDGSAPSTHGRPKLSEWSGQVLLSAYRRGWTVVIVPRAALRLYVCGDRAAALSVMPRAARQRWSYAAEDAGDCAARCLLELGIDFAQGPESFSEHPTATREVLNRLEPWHGVPVECRTLH